MSITTAIIISIAILVATIALMFVSVMTLLKQVTRIGLKTDEVHVLVNSNHEAMLRREEVLISALQKAGIEIPPNEDIVRPGTVRS